jgi:hypothetical protein
VLFALPDAQARACMQEGEVAGAEGQLRIGTARRVGEVRERPYILRLATPACLKANATEEDVKTAHTIHVYATEAAIRAKMRPLVGKAVRLTGRPYPAHTLHHHAPIVMDISAIAAR